jgi:ferredoxin
MAFVVTEACIDIKDKACMDDCPVDCLYEGDRMTYINADECIECGACQPLCPQNAIFLDVELPSALAPYAAVNNEFFAEVGAPGGSTDVDFTDRDHPAVAAFR